ncbi:hypothetical protein SpiGrapes_3092 [Sphaerochaeta pleomorpha str. Grapes]|uniref:Four-carbon acid sugar kinase family protein n=1 Tax=Sphaerochaeta pleomorpha (strain ATCC BAA-1885 / DSM 22778 / Grapes) TaxID=158190 RepID=G8QYY0_SPHPG|nr:four-carbon acid sugar kinase family protein [Sphaerochaeta pleomorpha]AEV30839.1 hypothetical protein SpiGrapes_3092 [Sphaerochaeta pleomorpha str. Grapes]
MLELVIIADDLTGALDTGVQFAKNGYSTALQVVTTRYLIEIPSPDIEVLIIDAEQRHLSDAKAEEKIIALVTQIKAFSPHYLFVKTDSGLRGPIGASLQAASLVYGNEPLAFIPSFPQLGRIAIDGKYFVEGKPVRESVFGRDPLNPVTITAIKDLFPSSVLLSDDESSGIHIYDSATTEEIANLVSRLLSAKVRLFAGCAALGGELVKKLRPDIDCPSQPLDTAKPLCILSGSLNAITQRQLESAEATGLVRFQLEPEDLFSDSWMENTFLEDIAAALEKGSNIAIDPGISDQQRMKTYLQENAIDDTRASRHIVSVLAQIVALLHAKELLSEHQLMVIGGDTLLAVLEHLQFKELLPLGELERGVVYSRLATGKGAMMLISKSGGFGTVQTIENLMR